MLSLTSNALKSSIFHPLTQNPSDILNPKQTKVKQTRIRYIGNPKPISASLIPANKPPLQQLYQPFRPPASPLPPKFRSLDTAGRIEVLASRGGLWFEYAPLISSLYTEGFTPPSIEELTGISGVEQNCLIVGAQVRDSLVQSGVTDPEVIAAFDTGGAELLYEIRLLSAVQRAAAATYIVSRGFDSKRTKDLARAVKDYPRRKGDKGLKDFDYDLPGDCLSFMYYRQSREHKNPSEQRTAMLELALEAAETEKAKNTIMRELKGEQDDEEDSEEDETVAGLPVHVVRLRFGEVAEASSVVVLPVCRAEAGETEVLEAPMELKSEGEFGIVESEKGWKKWVVLPGWEPVAAVGKGAVAVAFGDDGEVLPWRARAEAILVVVDRQKNVVEDNGGFYLVSAVGGGRGGGVGLKLEKGSALRRRGVEGSLGTVVMVVRPPREEDDQLSDEDWD